MGIRVLLSFILIVQVLYANSQEFNWAISVSGDNYELGIKAVKDSFENTYFIGYSTGSPIEYEGITYATNGAGDAFFAKLDTNKELIWMKTIGGDDSIYHDQAIDIHIDPFGDIYLSFISKGNNFTYNGQILSGINSPGQGGGEAVLLKVNSNGDYIWYDSGTSGSKFTGLTTDATGNLYITGSFDSTITLGGAITLTNPSSGTTADLLLAKYQPDGTILWAKNAGGMPHNTFAFGVDMEINRQTNDIIVLSKAKGEVYFDGVLMPVNSNSNEGSVLVSLDTDGTLNWMQKVLDLDSYGYYSPVSLDISNSGIVGVCGMKYYTGLVGFYNSDGSIISEQNYPSNDTLRIYSIAFNEYNNAYLSGWCSMDAVLGISPDTVTLTNTTGFIVKMNVYQQVHWVAEFTSSGFNFLNHVYYDNGKILYAGRIDDTFIYNSGQNTIINNAGDAIFAETEDISLTVETYLEEFVSIYPNPTTKTVYVSFENTVDNVELLLINVQGQIISKKVFNKLLHTVLELPDALGIYFLNIKTKEGQTTVKLIKK